MLEFMTIILSYLIHILFVSCIVWLEMKRMSQDPEFNPILDDLLRTDISLVFRMKTMKTPFWKNNRWFATRFNATHRIPYELWQIIFAYVQDDPQADMHFPFIISNVCKYWRKIADDNPCLWARVHVDLGRNRSVYRLQELLRRSGTRHLNVRIYHNKLSTEKDEVLRAKKVIQLLLPHYNRISHFHVEVIFPDTLEGIIPFLSGTASELRTLSLTSCPQLLRWNFNGIRVWGPIPHAFIMKSPRIQDVTLTAAACFQSPFLLGFLALRSLTLLDYDQMACIVADPSYLLNTLQRMKELTYLRLDGVPTDSIESFVGQLVPPTTIHALLKLQTLIVNKMPILFLRHLLSHMHTPSLTTISWTGIPHSIHSCYIFDVLSHNYAFPSLNTLRLAGLAPRIFTRILPNLNYCKHLSLDVGCSMDDLDFRGLVSINNGAVPQLPCPKLTSLELHSPDMLSVSVIRMILDSRREASTMCDSVARIRALRVCTGCLLSEPDRRWFTNALDEFKWEQPSVVASAS